MTIILPILIVSLALGVAAKRMSAALWVLMGAVIVVSIVYFMMRH
jgi:hypothetical protein